MLGVSSAGGAISAFGVTSGSSAGCLGASTGRFEAEMYEYAAANERRPTAEKTKKAMVATSVERSGNLAITALHRVRQRR